MINELEQLPPLLKISQVAKLLNVSTWTLRSWDKKDLLKPIRIGKRKDRRYRRDEIIRILNEGI